MRSLRFEICNFHSAPADAACSMRSTPRVPTLAAAAAAIALAALAGCAVHGGVDVGRPPTLLGGYRLASVPAADPAQFLGRRFDAATGEGGDRPCGQPPIEQSAAGQQLTATYQLDRHGAVDAGWLGFLTAGLDLSRLEQIDVELTTTSKASITVPSDCTAPVVFDAIAGSLSVRYHARQGTSVSAATEGVRARAGGSYQVDEERNVASLTLAPDLYVAYRVADRRPPPRPSPSGKKVLVVGSLLAAGAGLFALAYRADPDCQPSFDGSQFCMTNPGKPPGMIAGGLLALTGIGLIAVDF